MCMRTRTAYSQWCLTCSNVELWYSVFTVLLAVLLLYSLYCWLYCCCIAAVLLLYCYDYVLLLGTCHKATHVNVHEDTPVILAMVPNMFWCRVMILQCSWVRWPVNGQNFKVLKSVVWVQQRKELVRAVSMRYFFLKSVNGVKSYDQKSVNASTDSLAWLATGELAAGLGKGGSRHEQATGSRGSKHVIGK